MVVIAAGCSEAQQDKRLDVGGTDYAFTVSDTVSAGLTTITFTNRGKVKHEMSLARLKPGVTLRDVMHAQQQGKPADDYLIAGGVLFADAGETDEIGLRTELKSGQRYAMVCFFRDSAKAPPHVALGMMKEVIVAAR